MEGWQKGADAVLRLSSAGKERYFNRFPERKAWFEANHPEHFGRSVAAATTSLKKVTKAKQQKQRLASIRQAAEKRDQSTVLTPERRLMAQRRRESGEGLAGGMDTVADIRKSIAAGMPVRSGGIGSLFEQSEIVKKDGKWMFNGVPYNSREEAIAAKTASSKSTSTTTPQQENPAAEFMDRNDIPDELKGTLSAIAGDVAKLGQLGTAVKYGSPESAQRVAAELTKDWRERGMLGRAWPKPSVPGSPEESNWSRNLRQQGLPVYMSDIKDLDDYLTGAPAGSNIDTRQKRMPFSKTIQVGDVERKPGEMYFKEEDKKENTDMSTESNEFGKELAQKVIEEKRLQECMPMAMMIKSKSSDEKDNDWDYMDTWEKNPIAKGSTSSEAEDEPGEYDYEGDMAKSQLRSIMHNSKMLHDMLEDNTNLPEWVQSKITLAEDYILTAANYMRGELKEMDEEVEQVEEKYMGFKAVEKAAAESGARDPAAVAAAIGRKKYGKEKFQAAAAAGKKLGEEAEMGAEEVPFDPTSERKPGDVVDKSGAVHTSMSRVRHLAKMALQKADAPQPVSHEELMAQHVNLHTPKGEVMEEGTAARASARRSKADDLVKRSMLPDRSVIPAGKGFGDDIKREKIMKKVEKALQKKRMARPTDNPSANELVPQSMLPDVPGYPEGYQMEEQVVKQVVEQPVEQQIEAPVVEENVSPFVAAGSKFLTRTSTRLVYGDKNDQE